MSLNYSNYHSNGKISEITEHFVSLWEMGKILKNKNRTNPEKDSHIITFRKKGVRKQYHRNGPLID